MKHYVTIIIHAAMGDTLQIMATEISLSNGNCKMWDKGKMIMILSRTKLAKTHNFCRGQKLYYCCNEIFTYQENPMV